MTEIFDKLKLLQEILAEKYEIEREIEDSPKKLSTQDELLARLKKEFIVKNTEYEDVRARVGKLKIDLTEAVADRERGEKGMEGISTHREYEVLEKVIQDATESEQSIRKELHKEEKILTDLDENLKQDEKLILSQEDELNEGKKQLEEEIAVMRKQLDELSEKERDITPGINPEIIFKFERIIKNKRTGIVAVKGNVCEGCHMILPAQFANEVHAGETIHFCPYCSRILYYQELEDGESEFFQLDETGNLADLDDDFDDDDEDGDNVFKSSSGDEESGEFEG
ncbi:MAG: C4-type zinc ribbon domain-containing protein [Spirochaetales bacterium]